MSQGSDLPPPWAVLSQPPLACSGYRADLALSTPRLVFPVVVRLGPFEMPPQCGCACLCMCVHACIMMDACLDRGLWAVGFGVVLVSGWWHASGSAHPGVSSVDQRPRGQEV